MRSSLPCVSVISTPEPAKPGWSYRTMRGPASATTGGATIGGDVTTTGGGATAAPTTRHRLISARICFLQDKSPAKRTGCSIGRIGTLDGLPPTWTILSLDGNRRTRDHVLTDEVPRIGRKIANVLSFAWKRSVV